MTKRKLNQKLRALRELEGGLEASIAKKEKRFMKESAAVLSECLGEIIHKGLESNHSFVTPKIVGENIVIDITLDGKPIRLQTPMADARRLLDYDFCDEIPDGPIATTEIQDHSPPEEENDLDDSPEDVVTRLRRYKAATRESQGTIAEQAGLAQPQISVWMRGAGLPGRKTITKLIEFLRSKGY